MTKVLAIGGSIRANPQLQPLLLRWASEGHTPQTLKSFLESQSHTLSNTEVLAAFALLGAKLEGAELDYLLLNEVLSATPGQGKLPIAISERIRSAQAIVLISPVYFGDRSSLLAEFLQIAAREGYLHNKMVATMSVGAKRNGGQETTNIFMMQEALAMGASVIGNGPPSSQYGGTVQGGDKGDALKDTWGLMTAYETGQRIAQLARRVPSVSEKVVSPTKIRILITMDNIEGLLNSHLQQLVTQTSLASSEGSIKLCNLTPLSIEACIACDICPVPGSVSKAEPYGCIIKTPTDDMKTIQEWLLDSDGIILAGVNLLNQAQLINRYQVFMERTRFIRRNDFELTNIPVTSLLIEELGATHNELFGLKCMTSMLRHNCVLCTPIKGVVHEGKMLLSPLRGLQQFIAFAARLKQTRLQFDEIPVSYKAGGFGGYKDIRLDSTVHFRK